MNNSHLSDLTLDTLASGIGEPAGASEHLESCEACASRYTTLTADRSGFARTFNPHALAAETLGVGVSPPARAQWLWVPALAVAAAAVLGIALTRTDTAPPTTRTKGGAVSLELFVDVETEPTAVTERGVPIKSRLRLRYDPGGRRYTRVLWADPNGWIDALHPTEDADAVHEADPIGPRWMSYTIDLDDEPADEVLVAIFCDAPFDHDDALDIAENGGDCSVARLTVHKGQ